MKIVIVSKADKEKNGRVFKRCINCNKKIYLSSIEYMNVNNFNRKVYCDLTCAGKFRNKIDNLLSKEIRKKTKQIRYELEKKLLKQMNINFKEVKENGVD